MEKILRDSYNIQKDIDCKLGKLLKNSNEIKKLLKEKLAEIIQQLTGVNTKLESIKEDTTQLIKDNKTIIKHLEKIEENTDPTEIIRLLKLAIESINNNTVSIVEVLGKNHEELLNIVERNNNILKSLNTFKDLVDTKLKSIEDLLNDIKNGQVKAVELKGCVKSDKNYYVYCYSYPNTKLNAIDRKLYRNNNVSTIINRNENFDTLSLSELKKRYIKALSDLIPDFNKDWVLGIEKLYEKKRNIEGVGIYFKNDAVISKLPIRSSQYLCLSSSYIHGNYYNQKSENIDTSFTQPATLIKFFDRENNEIKQHRKCYIDGEESITNYEFSLDCEKFYQRETLKKLSNINNNIIENSQEVNNVLENLSNIKTLLTNIDTHTSEKLDILIEKANTQITQHNSLQNSHNQLYAKNLEKLQLLNDIKNLLEQNTNSNNNNTNNTSDNSDIINKLEKIILNQQEIIKNTDKQNVVSVTTETLYLTNNDLLQYRNDGHLQPLNISEREGHNIDIESKYYNQKNFLNIITNYNNIKITPFMLGYAVGFSSTQHKKHEPLKHGLQFSTYVPKLKKSISTTLQEPDENQILNKSVIISNIKKHLLKLDIDISFIEIDIDENNLSYYFNIKVRDIDIVRILLGQGSIRVSNKKNSNQGSWSNFYLYYQIPIQIIKKYNKFGEEIKSKKEYSYNGVNLIERYSTDKLYDNLHLEYYLTPIKYPLLNEKPYINQFRNDYENYRQ